MYDLTGSVHKSTSADAHIGHNRRSVPVPHCDKERTPLNEVFKDIPIEQAYHTLFDTALAEYNKNKKPSRQIANYYEHITKLYEQGEEKRRTERLQGATRKRQARISSTYQKPFNELIVSLGNMDSYGGMLRNGGELENLSLDTLREYIGGFEERNPNLFVFGAYLHRDEKGVPHLHIDYIPWSDEPTSRGLSKRVSESGAFKQMGLCGNGKYGTIAFQERERQALSEIARKHGINIIEGKHTKKHLRKEEYILRQEQEKVGIASQKVNEGAREVLKGQKDLERFLKESKDGRLYSEVSALREQNDKYVNMLSSDAERLKEYWNEFNSASGVFFDNYRRQKNELFGEIQKARTESKENRQTITALVSSILFDSDLLLIKVVKLFALLRHYIKGINLDNEINKLQNANKQIKATAKEVMSISREVGNALRIREYDKIENALEDYEKALAGALNIVGNMRNIAFGNEQNIER